MLRFAALLLLLCLPLACPARPAMQTVIHHCVGADGTPVFTDQPCASMDAVPATSDTNPFAPRQSAGPRTCPRDRKALQKRVADAFRTHDANALAGLMLWRGYSKFGAIHTVHDLAGLMQWPFLGFADASPASERSVLNIPGLPPLMPAPAQSATAALPSDVLTIHLGRPQQPNVTFAVTTRAGCLWLQP
ncbi:MAG TPA: hypothetical protein VFL78_06415 [Rhodanobacteraceae bacterium]|nr:hypothetical protein [Rhodanobacteraceae bacterium]